MARYKNVNWTLPDKNIETWDQVQVAVLMDIRDELQRMNSLLSCSNFIGIPHTLKSIDKKLTKKRPKKVKQ